MVFPLWRTCQNARRHSAFKTRRSVKHRRPVSGGSRGAQRKLLLCTRRPQEDGECPSKQDASISDSGGGRPSVRPIISGGCVAGGPRPRGHCLGRRELSFWQVLRCLRDPKGSSWSRVRPRPARLTEEGESPGSVARTAAEDHRLSGL